MASTTTTTSAVAKTEPRALTTEDVANVADVLGLVGEHKAALAAITSEGREGLSHSVTAAMAFYRDPSALDETLSAAQRLVRDAKAAKDSHNAFRVSIVAAVRAADPKLGPTAIANLMFGEAKTKETSAAKTQIGRDFHNLEAIAAVGAYNRALKAKNPKAPGATLTLPEAAKALRDKSAPQRAAVLKSLRETGAVPATPAAVVRNVKGSTAVKRAEDVLAALKSLDPAQWTAAQRTEVLRLLGEATAVATKTAVVKTADGNATKTA